VAAEDVAVMQVTSSFARRALGLGLGRASRRLAVVEAAEVGWEVTYISEELALALGSSDSSPQATAALVEDAINRSAASGNFVDTLVAASPALTGESLVLSGSDFNDPLSTAIPAAGEPSPVPSARPSEQPSVQPTGQPTGQPSGQPSSQPTSQPTTYPVSIPVNVLDDSAADPDSCAHHPFSVSAVCNFRSAWSYCANVSRWWAIHPGNTECRVVLPANAEPYRMLSQFGELSDFFVPDDVAAAGPFKVTVVGLSGDGGEATLMGDSQSLWRTQLGVRSALEVVWRDVRLASFGSPSADGGVFSLNHTNSFSLERVTVMDSVGRRGGGLYVASCGDLLVLDSVFRNNSAVWGGGVYASGWCGENATVTDTTFVDNAAGAGGGLLREL